MNRVVIVGASLAGVSAATALRADGFTGEIIMVGLERVPPYDRPPLSKAALAGVVADEDLYLRPTSWYEEHDITLVLGGAASGLDVDSREVLIDGGQPLGYDGLVIATGAVPRGLRRSAGRPGEAGVHVLRTLEDCVTLREQLAPGSRLVIVGAGFIGLEVAATATALGVQVTVLEMAPVPLASAFGEQVGEWIARLHSSRGVEIRCGVGVRYVQRVRDQFVVGIDDGSVVSAHSVVFGTGVVPTIRWLAGSKVAVGDGVVCDQYCRTNAPNVVAAGDVCRWYHPLFDESVRIEHWTNATEQGAAAARMLIGAADGPFAPVPSFWSDQFDAKIRFVGRAQAAADLIVEYPSEDSLIALYGRDGRVRGALCINAPRELVQYRRHIAESVPWPDIVSA